MSAGYLKKHYDSRGKPKEGYATQKQAEAFRGARIAAGAWRAENTNTYYCNVCGQYHAGRLGSINRGKGRKVKSRRVWHTQ